MIHKTLQLFEEKPDVTLTTYILDDSKEMLNGKKRPAVVINPGGAYLNLSDREAEPIAMQFAMMGYHTFVLRYSTYMPNDVNMMDVLMGKISNDMSFNNESQFPNPMIELGKAIVTIKEKSEEWFVDPNQIIVCGFSAGAHNAAMYATYWDKDIISSALNVTTEQLRPAAAILGYPLTDYVFMDEDLKTSIPELQGFFTISNEAFLGTGEPKQEQLFQVSPARLVSENTPPMFIWATAEDHLVPVEHSLRMAMSLQKQHIPFDMHIFENGEHGLATATQSSAATMDQMNSSAAQWIPLADLWLKKRFALKIGEMAGEK